jgi:hypothetical protein
MAIDVAARVRTETRAAFRLELRIGAAGAALDFKAAAVHVVSIPLKEKASAAVQPFGRDAEACHVRRN